MYLSASTYFLKFCHFHSHKKKLKERKICCWLSNFCRESQIFRWTFDERFLACKSFCYVADKNHQFEADVHCVFYFHENVYSLSLYGHDM